MIEAGQLWGGQPSLSKEGLGQKHLYAHHIKRKLEKRCPGLHFDLGGRMNIWHPRQEHLQGVRYYHKHICSMSRGMLPQFTVWKTKEQMVRVSVDEAARQAIPIFALDPLTGLPGNPEASSHGFAMKEVKDDIETLGWMELFHHLCVARLPGITPDWLAKTFNVNMGWFGKIRPEDMDD